MAHQSRRPQDGRQNLQIWDVIFVGEQEPWLWQAARVATTDRVIQA